MNKHSASRDMQHKTKSGETLFPARRVDLQQPRKLPFTRSGDTLSKMNRAKGQTQPDTLNGVAPRVRPEPRAGSLRPAYSSRVYKAGLRPRRC
jgi:hypothetical protein